MTNPVAAFYEFYLTIVNALPAPFMKFVALVFVCYFILAGLQLFWSTR
jgi:hypothetical protein